MQKKDGYGRADLSLPVALAAGKRVKATIYIKTEQIVNGAANLEITVYGLGSDLFSRKVAVSFVEGTGSP